MTKIPLSTLGALAAAVVFSIVPLVLAGDNRGSERLAVAPFGWNRVVVTHAVTCLPLSWILTVAVTQAWPILRKRWTVLLWSIAGVDIAGLSVFAGTFVAHELSALDAGPIVRLAVRILWCLLLQIPWCLAGKALQKNTISKDTKSENHAEGNAHSFGAGTILNFICWSLVVAIFIPLSFVDSLAARQTQIAHEHWKTLRIEKARFVTQRLCDVGSMKSLGASGNPVAGRDPKNSAEQKEILPEQAHAMLSENVTFLTGQIKVLKSVEASDSRQLLLGKYYAALDRLPQACEALEPLAEKNAEAAAKLGEICQWEGHWQCGNGWFVKAIELAHDETANAHKTASEREKLLSFAYDSLARGARELKQYDQAETVYRKAIADLPSNAAHFHAQLAQHYELGGRPSDAIEHQRRAHELAPDRYGTPTGLAVKILSNSTPVGIFAPAASNNE